MLTYKDDKALGSIKLVATDMDATLLADDKSMPPNIHELISSLNDAGITFCAASGRPLLTLKDVFANELAHMALISDNGAAIAVAGEVVHTSLIPHRTYLELLETTEQLGGIPVAISLEGVYLRSCDRCYDKAFSEYFFHRIYVDDLSVIDAHVNKFTIYLPNLDSAKAYASTFGPAFADDFSVTCAGSEWIDIMNKGVDKGSAVRWLCEHLGVDIADAATFGDTDNDTEMLEAAGHGFIMQNAEERMRVHANYMAPANNDRGVATVIEAILAAQQH